MTDPEIHSLHHKALTEIRLIFKQILRDSTDPHFDRLAAEGLMIASQEDARTSSLKPSLKSEGQG